jgi:hypothetical protein
VKRNARHAWSNTINEEVRTLTRGIARYARSTPGYLPCTAPRCIVHYAPIHEERSSRLDLDICDSTRSEQ